MKKLTERAEFALDAGLHRVSVLPEPAFPPSWAACFEELCEAGLLNRHVAQVQMASGVRVLCCATPESPQLDFGALAWELAKAWEKLEPRRVVFYTASDAAAKHFGRSIKNPLKAVSAIAHEIGMVQVYRFYTSLAPLFAKTWVAEDVIASVRSFREKVVDCYLIDSRAIPALAIDFAGCSYAASNGARLKEIDAACRARKIPYELWAPISEGGSR